MGTLALIVAATLAAKSHETLILEKIRAVSDPRAFDLVDEVKGDRGVPKSCPLAGKTTVSLVSGKNATLEVDRDGSKRAFVVENVRGVRRATLACGENDKFFYVNPRLGQVSAYSADRLFRGTDPVMWTRRIDPFTSLDAAAGVLIDASAATVLQARKKLVLVEWIYRKNGVTGFWHEVFDAATGAELAKIGPSDLQVKTNERDPWWVLFQGGGTDVVNYVPRNLYRLRYGPIGHGTKSAAETVSMLGTELPQHLKAVAKRSANPVINHMIALLSPTRTAANATIEFCPQVPAQRARYWLGSEYDDELGTVARNILLAFWAERQGAKAAVTPLDDWFQAEIAPEEPMKSVLVAFNPQDDAWIAQYQEALLMLGEPTFKNLFEKYGAATGAVVRTHADQQAP